jgi:hypothetical protein
MNLLLRRKAQANAPFIFAEKRRHNRPGPKADEGRAKNRCNEPKRSYQGVIVLSLTREGGSNDREDQGV